MDQDREGNQDTPSTLLKDKKTKTKANLGHQAIHRGMETAQQTATLEVKRPTFSLRVNPRRARINPQEKRATYITRLELLWDQLDNLITDTIDERNRIKAMNTLIRCLNIAYGMVEAVEIEEEIEALIKQEEEHGYLGYRLQEEQ